MLVGFIVMISFCFLFTIFNLIQYIRLHRLFNAKHPEPDDDDVEQQEILIVLPESSCADKCRHWIEDCYGPEVKFERRLLWFSNDEEQAASLVETEEYQK